MGYPVRQYQPTGAQPLLFLLVSSSDHLTPLTAATPTVTLSKNGGSFAAPNGAVTEVGNGWYSVAANYDDADTLGVLLLHATAAGADPCDDEFDVVAIDAYVGTTHEQFDTDTPLLALLISTADHITGLTGATPAGVLSQNGGAFAPVGGAFTELGHGWYRFVPAFADVSTLGPAVLHVTAAGADPADLTLDIIPAMSATTSGLLVSDVFDMMAVLDNETQLHAGGRDEGRAIAALNMALRQLDTIFAASPLVMQTQLAFGATIGRDWTARPTTLLRLDALWRLDPSTGRVAEEVVNLQATGATARGTITQLWNPWLAAGALGPIAAFTLDATRFHWLPAPDQAYTLRADGYMRTPRLTARTSGWYHTDETALAVAAVATRYLSTGVGDESTDMQQVVAQTFQPLLRSLRKATRTGPQGRVYTQYHTT